jgi:hypothetical protein
MVTPTPLPPWALEIIANGIQVGDDDRRPLFRPTLRVACSAINHGWSETEFRNFLQDGVKSEGGHASCGLWQQVNTRRGRKLSFPTVDRFLSKVWRCAEANVAKGFDPERESTILTVAQRWSESIAYPSVGLSRSEELVLTYVIEEVKRRKFANVACPGRHVAEFTGLSHRGAVEALTSLREKGILICRSQGTWVGKGKKGGKAAIYSLADPNEHFSLPGSITLPDEKPYENFFFVEKKTNGTHTNPLLGEGMCTTGQVYSQDIQLRRGENSVSRRDSGSDKIRVVQ